MFCGIYSGAWLAAAGVLVAGTLWAQPPAEPLVAAPGTHQERRLAGGGTDTFRIPLAAGQFVHLEVIQKGSDLAVTLRDPEGHSLMDMDSANNRYGPETVAAIAGAAGDYRLEVKDGNPRDAPTPYEVRVVELRQALSGDHNLVVALKNYNDGLRLWEQRTAAARQQAIEKHERARDFFRASGDGYMLGLSLFSLGAELGDSGEFRRALPVYQEAATLFRAAGDPRMEAQAFNNEGGARDVLGEPKEALRAYRQSLADHVQQGDRREQANLLNNIGVAEAEMGDWQNTLRDYRQALELCREAGDRRLQAIILNNTGVAYRNLGDTAQAQALFEQALPLRRAVGDKRGEATTLENLAETYRSIGQPAKALGYAEQALAPARALGDRRVEAGVLRFQASAYTDLRRYEDARRALQLALDLARAVQDRHTTGEVMLNLARAELSAGAGGNAADWSAQALSEFRAVGTATTRRFRSKSQPGQRRLAGTSLRPRRASKKLCV
jgi:tetratricopeptide (TPR) repeat protein